MTAAVRSCPEHGPAAAAEHRFCEACGRALPPGDPSSPAARQPPAEPGEAVTVAIVPPGAARWLSSRATGRACAGCGAAVPDGTDYCDHCGRRCSTGQDRAELDLGALAGVTERARRRHNEDALAIGHLDGVTVAVVCDGVSTSARSDAAAHAAAQAGLAGTLVALHAGRPAEQAVTAGTQSAARAARAAAEPHEREAPPSCTYVAAVVESGAVTVGWIGDSRAYWVAAPPGDPACLTVDDSPAGRRAAGQPVPATVADPGSRALLRWLGADSADAVPQLARLCPAGPGRLVLCSDGLSHYLPEPRDLARAIDELPSAPIEVARGLTRLALAAGGHDNVTVAVLPYPPPARKGSLATKGRVP